MSEGAAPAKSSHGQQLTRQQKAAAVVVSLGTEKAPQASQCEEPFAGSAREKPPLTGEVAEGNEAGRALALSGYEKPKKMFAPSNSPTISAAHCVERVFISPS